MSEVIQHVELIAPHVSFEILSNDVPNPQDVLDRGDIDLLIMPRDHLSKNHPDEVLFSDDYACLAWEGNSAVGESLSREDYLRLGHVCTQFSRGRVPVMDEWFLSRLGVNRRVEVTTMNFNSLAQYIVGTQRIGTTHRRMARYYCRYLPVRIVPCPYELPPFVEAMQWHKYFSSDPSLAWLRDVLKHVANRLEHTVGGAL
jgi:DNA-binding transcriptional LysR family regulator